MISALLAGFFLSLSLILAIGAQNAFVLRQGLRGEHVALVCFACAGSDALLIMAGVLGFGTLIAKLPWIDPVARIGGAVFLIGYAFLTFRSAWRGGATLKADSQLAPSWQLALASCLALTWLNPHVYLDTVLLLGAASVRYEEARLWFGLGAVCASFTFFFALGFGARLLQPVFSKPAAWRILDCAVGVTMLIIAVTLLLSI